MYRMTHLLSCFRHVCRGATGFDGFASSVAVLSAMFALILVVAVALNVRGGSEKRYPGDLAPRVPAQPSESPVISR